MEHKPDKSLEKSAIEGEMGCGDTVLDNFFEDDFLDSLAVVDSWKAEDELDEEFGDCEKKEISNSDKEKGKSLAREGKLKTRDKRNKGQERSPNRKVKRTSRVRSNTRERSRDRGQNSRYDRFRENIRSSRYRASPGTKRRSCDRSPKEIQNRNSNRVRNVSDRDREPRKSPGDGKYKKDRNREKVSPHERSRKNDKEKIIDSSKDAHESSSLVGKQVTSSEPAISIDTCIKETSDVVPPGTEEEFVNLTASTSQSLQKGMNRDFEFIKSDKRKSPLNHSKVVSKNGRRRSADRGRRALESPGYNRNRTSRKFRSRSRERRSQSKRKRARSSWSPDKKRKIPSGRSSYNREISHRRHTIKMKDSYRGMDTQLSPVSGTSLSSLSLSPVSSEGERCRRRNAQRRSLSSGNIRLSPSPARSYLSLSSEHSDRGRMRKRSPFWKELERKFAAEDRAKLLFASTGLGRETSHQQSYFQNTTAVSYPSATPSYPPQTEYYPTQVQPPPPGDFSVPPPPVNNTMMVPQTTVSMVQLPYPPPCPVPPPLQSIVQPQLQPVIQPQQAMQPQPLMHQQSVIQSQPVAPSQPMALTQPVSTPQLETAPQLEAGIYDSQHSRSHNLEGCWSQEGINTNWQAPEVESPLVPPPPPNISQIRNPDLQLTDQGVGHSWVQCKANVKPPIIVGKVSQWQKQTPAVMISGLVYDRPTEMVIDINADVSIIRTDLLPQEQICRSYRMRQLISESGKLLHTAGTANITITIGGATFRAGVYVADIADEFILGIDLMKRQYSVLIAQGEEKKKKSKKLLDNPIINQQANNRDSTHEIRLSSLLEASAKAGVTPKKKPTSIEHNVVSRCEEALRTLSADRGLVLSSSGSFVFHRKEVPGQPLSQEVLSRFVSPLQIKPNPVLSFTAPPSSESKKLSESVSMVGEIRKPSILVKAAAKLTTKDMTAYTAAFKDETLEIVPHCFACVERANKNFVDSCTQTNIASRTVALQCDSVRGGIKAYFEPELDNRTSQVFRRSGELYPALPRAPKGILKITRR